jgi:metallo-beta-lactamase family protein
MMKLTFLGASGTVTGSKYLIEFQDKKILVDCGLFQGLKELRLLNWQIPEFDPSAINAVLLTHGHLDHTGYLPRLVKLGFKGEIFATVPTLKIAEIILKDSAKIQEEEAERANRDGYSKHKPALPFYDLKDVEQTQKLFRPIQEGEWINIEKLCKVIFQYNGHIIGSTFIQVEAAGKTLVFSGDVGRDKDLLLYSPKKPNKADVLLIESTYGGKIHPNEEALLPELEQVVNETIHRGGSIFIPSFAVERTQLLMLILWKLLKDKRIPRVPMIMDSPMGANILDLFHHAQDWHKLKTEECNEMCSHFRLVSSYKETMQLRMDKKPKIVIAGSGMMTGGRILSYLEVRAANENDTLLFVGYQAEGTRGRKLLEGEKEIKIYGRMILFRMQIKKIEGLSAHGDQNDLLYWLSNLKQKPTNIFIVHGETEQAEAFKQKLKDVKHWEAEIPHLNQSIEI